MVKGGTSSIYVIGHEVTDAGDFAVNGLLPGEAADNFYNNNTAANNQFEGVYIDDVIIAPTERGMIVTGGTNQTDIVTNPEADPDLITTGTYQIEVRRSYDYGAVEEVDVDGDGNVETIYVASKEYHTNDRFAEQRSLVFPDFGSLYDGLSFTIGDGIDAVTFEFDNEMLANGVVEGHQPIPYATGDTDGEIALAFANAMNSASVQAVLDIKAAGQDFGGAVRVNETTSNVINLFGNALFYSDDSTIDMLEAGVLQVTPIQDGKLLAEHIVSDNVAISYIDLVSGTNSAGLFTGGHDIIGIAKGVVLSTGDISQIAAPNSLVELSGNASGLPSSTVDSVLGVNSVDSTTLTFDFVAEGTSLFMNAVFASEEYPDALP